MLLHLSPQQILTVVLSVPLHPSLHNLPRILLGVLVDPLMPVDQPPLPDPLTHLVLTIKIKDLNPH